MNSKSNYSNHNNIHTNNCKNKFVVKRVTEQAQ